MDDLCALKDLFEQKGQLRACLEQWTVYKQWRIHNSGLVSLLDDHGPERSKDYSNVLGIYWADQPLAVTSFMVQENVQKKEIRNRFGRIDLVMVPDEHRGYGLGRLVVLCTILQMLRSHGALMYSISCLAAHPSIEHILDGLGYTKRSDPQKNYSHMSLLLDEPLDTLHAKYEKLCAGSVQKTFFRLRQGRFK